MLFRSNAQIKYEVKITNGTAWSGIYLDASDAATLVQETSTNWSVTFTNEIPSARYIQIQVASITPTDPASPVSAIATVYVNGAVVKTDTASGYIGQFTPPFSQYLLQ